MITRMDCINSDVIRNYCRFTDVIVDRRVPDLYLNDMDLVFLFCLEF